jgi:hypothetical protein
MPKMTGNEHLARILLFFSKQTRLKCKYLVIFDV